MVAFKHHLHRAAGFLRQLRAGDAPGVRREFAAESATHVLHHDVDVVRGNFDTLLAETFDVFAGHAADVLRRFPDVQIVAIPFRHLAVGFEAAMRDHWNAVMAFADHFGLLEPLVRVAVDVLLELL